MFNIEVEGLTLDMKIPDVVQRLEDKYCNCAEGKRHAYLYGRLLGCYAMMKRVYHGFDRRMKIAPILTSGRFPRAFLGGTEFKKAQVYIDRANARALGNYRCFEDQFKNLFSQLGSWSPVRVTRDEQTLITHGWYNQSLFNDKMNDYIRARNKSKYGKEEAARSEAEAGEATAAE